MVDSKVVVHVLMTHYQKKGLGASAAAYETFSVKGEGIVDKGTKGSGSGGSSFGSPTLKTSSLTTDGEALCQDVEDNLSTSTWLLSNQQSTVIRQPRFVYLPHQCL